MSDFNEHRIFFNKLSKNTQISNFMKIRPVGAELFDADGQTDRHNESISRYPQFFEGA